MCSGRCRACDAILTDDEMCSKDNFGNYSDLCYRCAKTGDYEDLSDEWLPESTHQTETYLE